MKHLWIWIGISWWISVIREVLRMIISSVSENNWAMFRQRSYLESSWRNHTHEASMVHKSFLLNTYVHTEICTYIDKCNNFWCTLILIMISFFLLGWILKLMSWIVCIFGIWLNSHNTEGNEIWVHQKLLHFSRVAHFSAYLPSCCKATFSNDAWLEIVTSYTHLKDFKDSNTIKGHRILN